MTAMLLPLLGISFLLAITQSASAAFCVPVAQLPGANVETCGGVKLVHLSGTPRSRALTMGKLVSSGALSPSVIHYFSRKFRDIVSNESPVLVGPIMLAYHQLVRLFHSHSPPGIAVEVDAMAEGLGVDSIELRRGLSLPDTAGFLQGLGSLPGFQFLPAAGCTSVVTKDGETFRYGRNLDFAGVGTFDRHPMILSVEPEPGSQELKHLVIGADGLLFGGITGVNERGISFAVHQNFSRDIAVRGVPMLFIGELVLRSASNLEEAVALLRKLRPVAQWTFVLTDLNRKDAIAVESGPSHFFVRRMGKAPVFVQTNHLMFPETRSGENASFGMLANSELRMERAITFLEKDKGAVAAVLASQENLDGALAAHKDILKAITIQTVLFEASSNNDIKLSLSSENAPASSGKFVSFSLSDFWRGKGSTSAADATLKSAALDIRRRQAEAAEAFRLYFDERKPLEAARLMESQRTFDSALFRSVAFLSGGSPGEALAEAEKTLRDPRHQGEPFYLRCSLERVRLAALLRLGRLDDAVRISSSLLEQGGGPGGRKLFELASSIVKGKKLPAWQLNLEFDFFSGDLNERQD